MNIQLTGQEPLSQIVYNEKSLVLRYTNYEVGVRVPLIIYSPQHQYQQTWAISELVELVDLFPTIVDLAALPKIKVTTTQLFFFLSFIHSCSFVFPAYCAHVRMYIQKCLKNADTIKDYH